MRIRLRLHNAGTYICWSGLVPPDAGACQADGCCCCCWWWWWFGSGMWHAVARPPYGWRNYAWCV